MITIIRGNDDKNKREVTDIELLREITTSEYVNKNSSRCPRVIIYNSAIQPYVNILFLKES